VCEIIIDDSRIGLNYKDRRQFSFEIGHLNSNGITNREALDIKSGFSDQQIFAITCLKNECVVRSTAPVVHYASVCTV
jgi:hypothetical protein